MTKPLGAKRLRDLLGTGQKRPSSGKGRIPILALLCVLGLALIQPLDGFLLEQVAPTVWYETGERVHLGTGFIKIDYQFDVSRTRRQRGESDGSGDRELQETSYEGLQEDCTQTANSTICDALNTFASCERRGSRRPKRFLDCITIGLIAWAAICVVGWIGEVFYTYVNPNSSYNRLKEVETRQQPAERMRNLTDEIAAEKAIRQQIIDIEAKLDAQLKTTTDAVGQLARLIPSVAMSAGQFSYLLNKQRDMLYRMADSCRNDRASLEDYSRLFSLWRLVGLKPEDSWVEDVRATLSGLITTELYCSVISNNTRVHQIMGLPHYTDVKNDIKLLKYIGPRWALYNETNNCVRVIEDPEGQPIYTHCKEQNRVDSKFGPHNWVSVTDGEPDFIELSQPHIVKTLTESIISCLFHNIPCEGKEGEFPHYVFTALTGSS